MFTRLICLFLLLQAPELELGVIVMTSNCWPPTDSNSRCNLPPLMAKATKSFEKFYYSKHSGRCLTWQLSFGHADVKAVFETKTHELNVSTFALVILLLFNDLGEDDFLTYKVYIYIHHITIIYNIPLGNPRSDSHR